MSEPLEVGPVGGIGRKVLELVGIGSHVVEFVGRPGGAGKPACPCRQATGCANGTQLVGDRHAGRVIREVVAIEPGEKVADVAEAGIAGGAAEARGCVHPVAGRDHDVAGRGTGPEEWPALHPLRPCDVGEGEHRRPEIEQAHELGRRAGGLAAAREPRPPAPLFRHLHEQRDSQPMLGERPLAVWDSLAMVAPEDHDRVVGQPVGGELIEDFPRVDVEGRGQLESLGERPADHRRVGIVRGHRHVGPFPPGLRRQFAADGLGLVAKQAALVRDAQIEDGEEGLVGPRPRSPVRCAVGLVPARVE